MNRKAKLATDVLLLGIPALIRFARWVRSRRQARRRGEGPGDIDQVKAYQESKELYDRGREAVDRSRRGGS